MSSASPCDLRVLVIEDSDASFSTFRTLLNRIARDRGEGISVEHAATAELGLARLRTGVDLALVDCHLGGGDDGVELIREARAAGILCAIIMATASGDRKTDIDAADAGANDFLVKEEVTTASLARSMRYALRNAGMQARLAELNATLEDRVAATLAEQRRTEAALRHAEKMEAVGRATGTIAHDFRNVLTAVLGALEVLRERYKEDPRATKLIDSGLRAGAAGSRMIEDLMAFSHRSPRRPQMVRPAELIRETRDILQRSAGPSVTLDIDAEPTSGAILVDPSELQRALLNLVSNAKDAMSDGGTVSIRIRPAPAEGDVSWIRLSISDHGKGMSPELVGKAMEPFFTTKPRGSGTGLGLSQVGEFVRESGGRVELSSTPGTGTAVDLYFPEARESES